MKTESESFQLTSDPLPQTQLATQEPSVGELMQAVIKSGITENSVAIMERLVALKERTDARQAEKDFAVAFNALQADMPVIHASKPVPNRDGTIRYHFAPFEVIMEQVKPLLMRHGFTVAFSMDFRDGRVIQTCTLTHIGGHSRSNQFMARIGNGPPGSSEAQGDGAASTYAKRFALCNALNIVTEVDTDGRNEDARNEGAPISFEQAQTLRELVKETASNEAAFLQYAGAKTYEEIGSAKYQMLFNSLQKKLNAR